MDVVFNSIYARACMGAGLAVLSGFRAFLPIAFLALYAKLGFGSSPDLETTWFGFLEQTWVIAVLFALAVIELALDKMPAIYGAYYQIMRPLRIIFGGLYLRNLLYFKMGMDVLWVNRLATILIDRPSASLC